MSVSDESKITDCRFSENDAGKMIRQSKKKYRWEFTENGKRHYIELYDSKITGKKKIIANGNVILPTQIIRSLFSHAFHLGNNTIAIVQNGYTFECRINNFPFNHLIELQKNKSAFGGKQEPISSTYSSSKGTENLDHASLNNFSYKSNENKETNPLQFNFKIKPVEKDGENFNSSNPESKNTFENPNINKFNPIKNENYYNKIGAHSQVNKGPEINLLDVDSIRGTKTVNMLDMSPLPSPSGYEKFNFSSQPKQNVYNTSNINNTNNSNNTTNPNNKTIMESKDNSNITNDLNALFDVLQVEPSPKKELSEIEKLQLKYSQSFQEVPAEPVSILEKQKSAEVKNSGIHDFTPSFSINSNYGNSFLGQLRNSNPKQQNSSQNNQNISNFAFPSSDTNVVKPQEELAAVNPFGSSNRNVNNFNMDISSIKIVDDDVRNPSTKTISAVLENFENKENTNSYNIAKDPNSLYPSFNDIDHTKFGTKNISSTSVPKINSSENIISQNQNQPISKKDQDIFDLFN